MIVLSRRKNYTNHHLQEVYLRIKDQAYLQTTSLKGTKHFRVKGKLTPRFTGPLEITVRRRVDGYQLELSPELPIVHNVFHASHSGNVPNFLTSPVSTRTSITSHRPPAQYDLREKSQFQSGSSRTTNTKPCH